MNQDTNLSIVSVHSYKGGVGKTSMSVLLGAALAKQDPDCTVILVDLDILAPGMHHILPVDLPPRSILHYLVADYNVSPEQWDAAGLCVDALPAQFENLQVIPCSTDSILASKAQMYILGDVCSGLLEARLETMLEEIRDADYVDSTADGQKKQVVFVLDCPPSLFGTSRAAFELTHRNGGCAVFVCNAVYQDLAGLYEMILLQEAFLNEDEPESKLSMLGLLLNRISKDAAADIQLESGNDQESVRRKFAANVASATGAGADRTMRKLLESALEAYRAAIVLDCKQISAMSAVDSQPRELPDLEKILENNQSIMGLASEIGRALKESQS